MFWCICQSKHVDVSTKLQVTWNLFVPKSRAQNHEKTEVITDAGILAFVPGQIYINRNLQIGIAEDLTASGASTAQPVLGSSQSSWSQILWGQRSVWLLLCPPSPPQHMGARLQIDLLETWPQALMFWTRINSLITVRMPLKFNYKGYQKSSLFFFFFLILRAQAIMSKLQRSQISHKILLGQWNHPKLNFALRLDFNRYVNSFNLQLSQVTLKIIFTSNRFFPL